METPKRGRGRPRKDVSTPTATSKKTSTAARDPGRPRRQTSASAAAPAVKAGRGRPRKDVPAASAVNANGAVQKRGPGRPPKAAPAAATALVSKAAPVPLKAVQPKVKSIVPRHSPGPKFTTAARSIAMSLNANGLPYETYNVFSAEKFHGNALAVVHIPLGRNLSRADKQAIAKEFNYSETTFVTVAPRTEWKVEIFTPFEELPFAGHPCIGTICSLATQEKKLKAGTLAIEAGKVPFTVERSESSPELITASAEVPHKIHLHSTGLSHDALAKLQPGLMEFMTAKEDSWPMLSITKGMTFVLIEVPSFEALGAVRTTNLDVAQLVKLDDESAPSFVSSYFYCSEQKTEESQNLSTRMIEKDIGEDAVTGSAACALSAYLAMHCFHETKLRSQEYIITQGEHMGRSGTPKVIVNGDAEGKVESMELQGQAVRLMQGVIDIF